MGTFALMGDFKKLMGWETTSSPNPAKRCALLYLFFFVILISYMLLKERYTNITQHKITATQKKY